MVSKAVLTEDAGELVTGARYNLREAGGDEGTVSLCC